MDVLKDHWAKLGTRTDRYIDRRKIGEVWNALVEARANKTMGDQDAALSAELQEQKTSLEAKFDALSEELHGYWNEWDAASGAGDNDGKTRARDLMVDLLNRRSYIRNLVRDVNEVLEN